MIITPNGPDSRLTRKVAAACGVGLLLLGVSACGSAGNSASATGQSSEQSGSQTRHQGGFGGGYYPGANGKVAAVDGSTAQVQSQQSGQVAVTWTASTTFTKQVAGSLSDVKVGDCVLVGSNDQSASSGATTPPTAVTATTVRIIAATNGPCGFGRPGAAGGSSARFNNHGPSGAPVPEGGGRPQFRGFGGAIGAVAAVSATGFTVSSASPGTDAKTTVSVMVNGSTTYTKTAKAAASDVRVGVCVQATGKTDDTGAVTASRIAVSTPVAGECGGGRLRSSGGASSGRAS